MKRCLLLLGMGLLLWGDLFGQNSVYNPGLQLTPPVQLSFSDSLAAFKSTNAGIIPTTPHLIPVYARENPRGYSYLCRLEIEAESRLPVGIWVKVGDSNGLSGQSRGNANVRLRLFTF